MSEKDTITVTLASIGEAILRLQEELPERAFTIDGRLVGDIGEVIAARDYDLTLSCVQTPDLDGVTSDGRQVQVKVTFKDSLTLRSVPKYYLGLRLHADGSYEEVFNGPGSVIYERYKHRKGIGRDQLCFPVRELRRLSEGVADSDRIPRRRG